MSPNEHPRGILRNRGEHSPTEPHEIEDHLDRQEVIKNTRLNSQLASESSKGDRIRAQIAEQKAKQHDPDSQQEHLKWDEINLYKTEQEKCSTMKIDEPKTPYEGGFNPEGEYYKDDDEEEIPTFELGEGEFNPEKAKLAHESLNGGEIIEDPSLRDDGEQDQEEEEEEEEEKLTAEERHRRFEEKRKEHYQLKGNALRHKIEVSDDDDE